MKKLLLLFTIAACAIAQAPNVTATTTITASAGTLSCTGTPGADIAGRSTMSFTCKYGTDTITVPAFPVPSTPATNVWLSVGSGTNTVTWMVTKGNPLPDQWQVAATDGSVTAKKTGSF
jgi:hypothetical protein